MGNHNDIIKQAEDEIKIFDRPSTNTSKELIAELSKARNAINECLQTLTEMRYFKENHKMQKLAWNAIHALSPELAALNADEAYSRVHRDEERAEFEKWWKLYYGDVVGQFERLGNGDYAHDRVQIAFDAWMGRAKHK